MVASTSRRPCLCSFGWVHRQVNEDDLKEFGTLSGYLCSQAGEIPAVGDYVVVGGYMFTVTKVGFTMLRSRFFFTFRGSGQV